MADAVYIEPLTPDVIRRVIQRERPEGLLPTLGGQTGLNLAVEVAELGILDQLQRQAAGHAARVDPEGRGPGALQEPPRRNRRTGSRQRDRHIDRGGDGIRQRGPTSARDPAGVYAGRHRAAALPIRRADLERFVASGISRQPDWPSAARAVSARLERDRV